MTAFERATIKYAGIANRPGVRAHAVLCRDRRGFSLVELITVLAVIGVLAAIALPMYSAYTDSVKIKRCMADLRTIDKAVTAYYLDNNAYPVNLSDIGTAANQFDPWGRPYVYQNLVNDESAALEDQYGMPLNTDYDLYSKGNDGLSGQLYTDPGSADDIVRSNNGIFVGPRDPQLLSSF